MMTASRTSSDTSSSENHVSGLGVIAIYIFSNIRGISE